MESLGRSAKCVRGKPLVAFDTLLRLGVRLNQVCVDCEPFATDQPLPDAGRKAISQTRRKRSLSRKRPCLFSENVE